MRILIATPLYPPDIAGHAPYVKELASRLKNKHQVTVIAYNHIPEQIEGVGFTIVEKNLLLPIRVALFTVKLFVASLHADIVFVQNGASTELPMIIASLFSRTPYILRLGDEKPLCLAQQNFLYRKILGFALHAANEVVTHTASSLYLADLQKRSNLHTKAIDITRPLPRPEILPFTEYPHSSMEAYEEAWTDHTEKLNTLFAKYE
jgi:glycosyltransferase involved in cell wall biosynthesis